MRAFATLTGLLTMAFLMGTSFYGTSAVQAQAKAAPSPQMSFFITSAGPGDGANLGGLAGADRHCAALAAKAGAPDRGWRAYLSTQGSGAVNARDRIGSGPWYNAKGVVIARDTPGFIANRIGVYWSYVAMSEALQQGLTVEEADSIVGRPMGIPKTGIFGLADLTGIDLAPHINASMLKLLPKDDPFAAEFEPDGALPKLIAEMIAKGRTGRKGGGGFYRRVDGAKQALDFATGEYPPQQKARLESAKAAKAGLRALVEHPDKGGKYAWAVLSRTLSYAARLAEEIAFDLPDVDRAMKTGYAWKHGPFEQIDQLGPGYLAGRLKAEGRPAPKLLEAAGENAFYKTDGEKALHLVFKGR